MQESVDFDQTISISVVVPIFNEVESISELISSLKTVLDQLQKTYEIILVDDGSHDGSDRRLAEAACHDRAIKVIQFRRNTGQTAALMAGIDHANGEIIITIDADLQNDPRDIPSLLQKIEEGADVVSGWRKERQDDVIRRILISRIANSIISRVSSVSLHDYGCTLKAYRREMLQGMRLYGEMHRFVPIYASWMGARVVEIPVRHHARKFGKSKYGLNRTFKVVLDLLLVMFFAHYFTKPIYVFGGFGLCSIVGGLISIGYALYLKFVEKVSLIQTPLPLFAALLILIGISSIMMGILAEIMVRTYFESQKRSSYNVKRLINLDRVG